MSNRNIYFAFILILSSVMQLTSCKDDEAEFTAPTFSGVTVEPNPCHEGDSITITFNYADRGQNWYYFKQNISIDGVTVFSGTKSTNYFLSSTPYVSTVAPAAGTHSVSINGTLAPTAGTALYVELQQYTTTFEVSADDESEE